MHLKLLLLCASLVYCSGLELQSDESEARNQLHAVVSAGKRLKLVVSNTPFLELGWRFNGTALTEKCDVTTDNGSSVLVCPDMNWSDAGLYEVYTDRANGQPAVILAVAVQVQECPVIQQQTTEQQINTVTDKIPAECYCSGITKQCRMASNLFRSKLTVHTRGEPVRLKINKTMIEEVTGTTTRNMEQQLSSYYSLPKPLVGNLLKSYGGYFEFPSVDDGVDEDDPDVILKGEHGSLVYHNRRELISNELTSTRILMTEASWLQLDGSPTPKNLFMLALQRVQALYVKANHQHRSMPSLQLVLDSADTKDHGFGKVNTVEECVCRPGYTGLSCERCDRGYFRRRAIQLQGVCISAKEKLAEILELQKKYNYRGLSKPTGENISK